MQNEATTKSAQRIQNFGRNRILSPQSMYAPRSEKELLEILRRHASQKIRAIGRLHSWSEAPLCPDVLVDLRHFSQIAIHADEDSPWAEIGAGCQIHQVLTELNKQGWTMPSLGLITEQALAGAISTGTHGSGRHSLSHYVQSVRIASYDPISREPVIRTIDTGEELRAARCSLGCLGLITSVRLPIRRQYFVEEHFRRYKDLEDVLQAEKEFDLQQFFFLPWRWDFFAQHRREIMRSRSRLAPLYRLYWSVGMDVVFHLAVLSLARWLPRVCTRFFYRQVVPRLIPQSWKVVDRSDRQLTMNHQLFRHIEIEIFVRQSRLARAVRFVRWLLDDLDGKEASLEDDLKSKLNASGDWEFLQQLKGRYCHHYPICIRKVLPDDTLISMASGGEAYYAMSFISYANPDRREGFLAFADILSRTMATLFEARPHWGKLCPLNPKAAIALYPDFAKFRQVAHDFDPQRVFGNGWTDELLGRSDASEEVDSRQ